ncbi:hypothetical protein LI058_04025 [Clostridium perfringens]|uniref:Uncharacterized protein n=2 Tax=Clostridium perfringens TaxID=1502 RepID=A0A2X3E3I3_CLOPF|nr:hypothetical protein [Clostridium perfringens]AMN34183.1 hypothetical protein JFP55_04460 [Clostridium perfringens]AQW28340.1 hypothetical protein BXT94_13995 [Clostridium perfringens]ASY53073.1 hypothetical protein BG908_12905 [Clostridium perfringens]AWS27113.1 hypothetical protein CYK96_15905 [Clostridium perfringens]EIF6174017.1 hypothetical protein [Clostridium perfringens]
MRSDYFLELENIQFELSKLMFRRLNADELEYRRYLISKIERISKEIMSLGNRKEVYRLEDKLKSFMINYNINLYYKLFILNKVG